MQNLFANWAINAKPVLRKVARVRGKWWFVLGAAALSLIFTDVRESIRSRVSDLVDFLTWLTHLPDHHLGQWLIVVLGFLCIALGIIRGAKAERHASSEEIEAYTRRLEMALARPNRISDLHVAWWSAKKASRESYFCRIYLDTYKSIVDKSKETPAHLSWGGELFEIRHAAGWFYKIYRI